MKYPVHAFLAITLLIYSITVNKKKYFEYKKKTPRGFFECLFEEPKVTRHAIALELIQDKKKKTNPNLEEMCTAEASCYLPDKQWSVVLSFGGRIHVKPITSYFIYSIHSNMNSTNDMAVKLIKYLFGMVRDVGI